VLHRVREIVKPLVPPRLRADANRAVFAAVGVALHGDAVECPCCGRRYRRFVRYPTEYCPGCGSYERQRALCLYLESHPQLVEGDILQIGPERSTRERFGPRARSWLGVDLDPDHPLADRTMDVLRLDLDDEGFDLVLCAHVIDLVEPHDDAVAELYRVTRVGGTAVIQAPWRFVRGETDRYAERLERAGFRAAPTLIDEQRDERLRAHYGLDSDDPMFVCLRTS
jgi:SAM-dependent methyltransferase